MECLQQPTFTKKISNLQKLSFAKCGPSVQNCEIKWLGAKISTVEILVGAVIMFSVTCSLVLHACNKLVTLLVNSINNRKFISSIKGKSSIFSGNRCFRLWPSTAALLIIMHSVEHVYICFWSEIFQWRLFPFFLNHKNIS